MSDRPVVTRRPERIFISVDESTGRSTMSFAPPDAGAAFRRDSDPDGSRAMEDARAIIAKYPGVTIHGPHFHAAATGRVRQRRKP